MNKENACSSASKNDLSEASKDISLEESAVWRDKMVDVDDDVAVETTRTDGIYHGAAKNAPPMLMDASPRSVTTSHFSKTAPPPWQQLVASQCRSLGELSGDSSRGQQLSETLKAAAMKQNNRSSSQKAHAVGDSSGRYAPPGGQGVPKIPARQQQEGDEANQKKDGSSR
jgi:hypothetical protein